MAQQTRHLDPHDIAVGIDLASEKHTVVVLTAQGDRLLRFSIPHSRAGLEELLRRIRTIRSAPQGRPIVAFEATGHVWGAVAYWLREAQVEYRVVNPLTAHRIREARQLDKDKRDVTDAEEIAQLLRTGMVTQTQLPPIAYLELRRLWGEFNRLRGERARLKTLVKHQLYGLFPELVSNWKDIFAPGALAVLRLGWTPRRIAEISSNDFFHEVRQHCRGRRLWRFKINQAHRRASQTVATPEGAEAFAAEIRRIIGRADLLCDQMEELGVQLRSQLEALEEARYLATLPGIAWTTVAGLIAEIGPVDQYRHGRQLIKLAGLNPSRRESGKMAGRTTMTHRGRAGLRTTVYMATLSSLQHNPRLRAHYDRLLQRRDHPMTKMQAFGACMTKFLLYAFAVMHKREPFDINHQWQEVRAA